MHRNAANTDEYIQAQPEWQQANLRLFQQLIHKSSPDITEEIKWGVPVFLFGKKLAFAMASFKAHTKYNFIGNGALLNDHDNLFNSGLESKKSRGIDLRAEQTVDQAALERLITQAIEKL